jgi:hypothetical protein
MHQQVGVRVALFIIALASLACAQAAPSNLEIPTGDVWPSKEELIPLPSQGPEDDWEVPSWNLSPSRDAVTPNPKTTAPSEYKSSKSFSAPRTSIGSGKHPHYARVTDAVGRRHCLGQCLSHNVRRARCAVDVWRPDSHIGAWCL